MSFMFYEPYKIKASHNINCYLIELLVRRQAFTFVQGCLQCFLVVALLIIGTGCSGPARSNSVTVVTRQDISLAATFRTTITNNASSGVIMRLELFNKSAVPIECPFAYAKHPDIEITLRMKNGAIIERTPAGRRICHEGDMVGYTLSSSKTIMANSAHWWDIDLSEYFILPSKEFFVDIEFPVNENYFTTRDASINGSLATPTSTYGGKALMLRLTGLSAGRN